jgi:hypothetical protein
MNFSQFTVWWRSQWASTFGMARISRPGEGTNTSDVVQIQAATATTPEVALPYTRAEQFGDVRIPPKDAPANTLGLGAGGLVWSNGTSQRPDDGKAGDRGLYCDVTGARLHLYGSKSATPGRVRIDSATGAASPESVVVNGGTKRMARVDDRAKFTLRVTQAPVTMTTTQVTLALFDGVTATTILQFTFVGAAAYPPPGVPLDVEVDSVIFEGAEHFLG